MKRRAALVAAGKLPPPTTGRPRLQHAARYPSGRIKPPEPNARVVAERRFMLGDPDAKGLALRHAENAADLMLARGWLTKPLHEAAQTVTRLYKAALPPMVGAKTTSIVEEPTREAAIDRLRRGPVSPVDPDGDPRAMAVLRGLWRVLSVNPAAHREVVGLCLLAGSWPSWLVAMIEKRPLSADEADARRALFWGLHNICAALGHPALLTGTAP
ncbi:MAG: hypothetical protein JOZ27_06470 [Caulobacteraceae bacterium]|nr:hypothetical protein [Caulobacteraceae bacterium]